MASQILSGSGNLSYTNNTGQNVRIVIVYMSSPVGQKGISISWAEISASADTAIAMGKNLAFSVGMTGPRQPKFGDDDPGIPQTIAASGMIPFESGPDQHVTMALPSEICLAPNQTFSATCGSYNVLVIPEGG